MCFVLWHVVSVFHLFLFFCVPFATWVGQHVRLFGPYLLVSAITNQAALSLRKSQRSRNALYKAQFAAGRRTQKAVRAFDAGKGSYKLVQAARDAEAKATAALAAADRVLAGANRRILKAHARAAKGRSVGATKKAVQKAHLAVGKAKVCFRQIPIQSVCLYQFETVSV
jgi:hypothetical protein